MNSPVHLISQVINSFWLALMTTSLFLLLALVAFIPHGYGRLMSKGQRIDSGETGLFLGPGSLASLFKADKRTQDLSPLNDAIQDTLLDSVAWMCEHYGRSMSMDALVAGLPKGRLLTPSQAMQALSGAGIAAGLVDRKSRELPSQLMPMLVLRKDQGAAVLLDLRVEREAENKQVYRFSLMLPEFGNEPVELDQAQMMRSKATRDVPRAGTDRDTGRRGSQRPW